MQQSASTYSRSYAAPSPVYSGQERARKTHAEAQDLGRIRIWRYVGEVWRCFEMYAVEACECYAKEDCIMLVFFQTIHILI